MPGEFQFEAVKLEDTFVTSSHLKTKTNSQFDLESTLKFFNGPKKVFNLNLANVPNLAHLVSANY